MILGIVSGNITSTINHPFYDNRKLLVVDLCHPDFTPTGDYLIAVDAVDAGVGQRVLINYEGNGGRQVFASPNGPIRTAIVGIVDHVDDSSY